MNTIFELKEEAYSKKKSSIKFKPGVADLLKEKHEIKRTKAYSSNCVILEGRKLLLDALNSSCFHFEHLFFTERNEPLLSKIVNTPFKNTTLNPLNFIQVTEGQAEKLADCVTTDGLIGLILIFSNILRFNSLT